jgi:hypothetical protein
MTAVPNPKRCKDGVKNALNLTDLKNIYMRQNLLLKC